MKHRLSRKAGALGILLSALAAAALLGTGDACGVVNRDVD
jgi:hypothetical protein